MNIHHVSLVAAVLLGSLSAQSVSVSLQSLSGINVSKTESGVVAQSQLPAGPVGPWGGVSTGPFSSASASVTWNSSSTATASRVWLAQDLLADQVSSAQAGGHQMLVTFTPNGVVPSRLILSRLSSTSPGTVYPGVSVDIGNTGNFVPLGVSSLSAAMPALGTQPLEVLVMFDPATVTNGYASEQIDFELLPENHLAFVQSAASCAWPAPLTLDLAPSFVQRGVDITAPVTQSPAVLVLGLSSSPFLLSTPVSLPCLVVPSPDVLLLVQPNVVTSIRVSLPLAVRPVAFHAQVVALSSVGLLVSDAYVIQAL
jgi:hypothetical protein